jgi:hypothetical protein
MGTSCGIRCVVVIALAVAGCSHASSGDATHATTQVSTTGAPAPTALGATSATAQPRSKHAIEQAHEIPRRLPPDATGAHETHGCARGTPGRYVTITLDPDTPLPECVIVGPNQRLRVVNMMVAVLHSHARRALVRFADVRPQALPVGDTLVFSQPIGSYLDRGEHFLYYGTERAGVDIWLKMTH